MKHGAVVLSAVLCLTTTISTPASAGPYGDDLSKCLVKSSSDADKNLLIKWLFAGVTLHSELKGMSSVSDAQREELSKAIAKVVERLLTDSCKTELQAAVKYEGRTTLVGSFQVLGQVAAMGMFSDQNVSAFMSGFVNHLDKEKLEKVIGVVPQ